MKNKKFSEYLIENNMKVTNVFVNLLQKAKRLDKIGLGRIQESLDFLRQINQYDEFSRDIIYKNLSYYIELIFDFTDSLKYHYKKTGELLELFHKFMMDNMPYDYDYYCERYYLQGFREWYDVFGKFTDYNNNNYEAFKFWLTTYISFMTRVYYEIFPQRFQTDCEKQCEEINEKEYYITSEDAEKWARL